MEQPGCNKKLCRTITFTSLIHWLACTLSMVGKQRIYAWFNDVTALQKYHSSPSRIVFYLIVITRKREQAKVLNKADTKRCSSLQLQYRLLNDYWSHCITLLLYFIVSKKPCFQCITTVSVYEIDGLRIALTQFCNESSHLSHFSLVNTDRLREQVIK